MLEQILDDLELRYSVHLVSRSYPATVVASTLSDIQGELRREFSNCGLSDDSLKQELEGRLIAHLIAHGLLPSAKFVVNYLPTSLDLPPDKQAAVWLSLSGDVVQTTGLWQMYCDVVEQWGLLRRNGYAGRTVRQTIQLPAHIVSTFLPDQAPVGERGLHPTVARMLDWFDDARAASGVAESMPVTSLIAWVNGDNQPQSTASNLRRRGSNALATAVVRQIHDAIEALPVIVPPAPTALP